MDAFNHVLMAYFRHIHAGEFSKKVPLISKPLAIRFELHCMREYLKLLEYFLVLKEKETTLAEDTELLETMTQKEGWTYNMRFAVIYRAERKKILHSQVRLLKTVVPMLEQVFQLQRESGEMTDAAVDTAFDKIIMQKSEMEVAEETEEPYFLRRLHMRDYFKDLKRVVSTHKSFQEAMVLKAKNLNEQSKMINTKVSEIKKELN